MTAGEIPHWWKRPGGEPAIVGYSTATGEPFESRLTWQAHGTVGRSQSGPRSGPAWEILLTDFTELDPPVSLSDIRAVEHRVRAVRDDLEARVKGALYFPYALSDKRPLRTTQGYLVKMPAALLDVLPGITVARKPPARRGAAGTRGTGRQQDPVVRRAVERHAVDWVLSYFDVLGFAVDDVGATESFDVLAFGPDDEELHIEVKGSSTDAIAVELTEGEVGHWGTDFERVLVVVDQIRWHRDGTHVSTSGGRPRIWRDWELQDDALAPIRYRYTLPSGGSTAL